MAFELTESKRVAVDIVVAHLKRTVCQVLVDNSTNSFASADYCPATSRLNFFNTKLSLSDLNESLVVKVFRLEAK